MPLYEITDIRHPKCLATYNAKNAKAAIGKHIRDQLIYASTFRKSHGVKSDDFKFLAAEEIASRIVAGA